MDRIISVRIKRAEKQAKQISMLSAALLAVLAVIGVFVSIQFGWTSGTWFGQLPLVHLLLSVGGFLLLLGVDSVFSTTFENNPA